MEKIFFEIFELLPRQGPGDDASTKKAFRKLTELPRSPEILDIGCGVGKQTMTLAKLTSGKIIALDNHSPFIEILKRKIDQAGYSNRINCVIGDMASMEFADKSFDLVWSEGSSFIMGLENALKSWKRLLRPRGYMVISDLVWFKEDPPKEIKDFFVRIGAQMEHYKHIYSIIESAGYKLVYYFPLPDRSWWTNYYIPMEKVIAEMKIKYKGNNDVQPTFDMLQLEKDMYKKYSKYYGYGFYIMQVK